MRTRLFVFVSIVQAILFLAHWFVYATIVHFWSSAAGSWNLKLAFCLLSISFVAASLRGWYSYHPLVRIFYTLSAVWMGFASFLLLASGACWITSAVNSIAGMGWRPAWIADAAFAAAAAAGLYGILNAAGPRVSRITVVLPGLPPQWRGRTAALVSDLHLGHVRNVRFVRRVVNKISALQPDIALIAGDLYDGVAGDFEKLAEPWKKLTSPAEPGVAARHAPGLGVYYIAGNHEEFYRHAEYLPPLLRTGIRVLNNEKVEIDGLQLIGVHYQDAAHPDHHRTLLKSMSLDRTRASVLLLHAPVRLPINEEEGISLPGIARILELENQVVALRARVAELATELDAAHARSGRGTRVFSVSPRGDVYAARLGERPRHDRSTALVVWRPLHSG